MTSQRVLREKAVLRRSTLIYTIVLAMQVATLLCL